MSLQTLMSRVANSGSSAGRLVGILESELAKPLLVNPAMLDSYARSLLQMGATAVVGAKTGNVHTDHSSSVNVTTYYDLSLSVLDISGPLVNRDMNAGPCTASPVSYAAIRSQIETAVADKRIKTVVARIDSGGGMASQMVDLNEFIRKTVAANPHMRFIASIDDVACSAAYGIACAFPERYISRTGIAGSIGVVVRHQEASKMEANIGIVTTYIYAGAHKVLGNSSEPLSDAARNMIESQVKMHYDLFVKCVSDSLGVSEKTIRATEAAVYQGQQAVDNGLATGIMTFTELLLSIEDNLMLEETNTTAATAVDPTVTPVAETAPAAVAPVVPAVAPAAEVAPVAAEVAPVATVAPVVPAADATAVAAEAGRVAAINAVCKIGGIDAVSTQAFIDGGMSADSVSLLVANKTATIAELETTLQVSKIEPDKQEAIAKSWQSVLK